MHIETFTLGELDENGYLVLDAERAAAIAIDPGDRPEPMIARLEQTGARLLAVLLTHGHWDHVAGVRELAGATSGAAGRVPVYLHEADLPLYEHVVEQAALFGFRADPQPSVDRTVKDGDVLELGPFRVEVIHTPGHTPGGVCYKTSDARPPQGSSAETTSVVQKVSRAGGMSLADQTSHAHQASRTGGAFLADETSAALFVGDTIFAGGVGRTDLPGGSWNQLIRSIRTKILTLDDNTTLYPGHGPATTVGAERATNPFLT